MQSGKDYRRVVVKIGASLLAAEESGAFSLDGLAEQVSSLIKDGREVIIISSGAIAKGMRVMKLRARPTPGFPAGPGRLRAAYIDERVSAGL